MRAIEGSWLRTAVVLLIGVATANWKEGSLGDDAGGQLAVATPGQSDATSSARDPLNVTTAIATPGAAFIGSGSRRRKRPRDSSTQAAEDSHSYNGDDSYNIVGDSHDDGGGGDDHDWTGDDSYNIVGDSHDDGGGGDDHDWTAQCAHVLESFCADCIAHLAAQLEESVKGHHDEEAADFAMKLTELSVGVECLELLDHSESGNKTAFSSCIEDLETIDEICSASPDDESLLETAGSAKRGELSTTRASMRRQAAAAQLKSKLKSKLKELTKMWGCGAVTVAISVMVESNSPESAKFEALLSYLRALERAKA